MNKIFNILLNIACKYINKSFYKFYINKYQLNSIMTINNFFQDEFDVNYLLEYLFEIKNKIAVDFILMNQIDGANIDDFATNIYDVFNNNMMLLFLINRNINKNKFIYHQASLLKKAVFDANINENIDQYIIGALCEYIITPEFFEFILKQDNIKNIKDIHDTCNNIDINLIKEYINKYCYYKICDSLSKDLNEKIEDDIYDYIYNNDNIIQEIKNRIQYNFSKIIYRDFFEHGKYLNKLTQASDLANIQDKKEQQTYIIRTDINNRDKAFIDIDHHILISEPGEIHKDLFNRYTAKDNVRFNRGRRRPTKKDVETKTDIKCWAYGHISNNIYIIDGVNNISIDDVVNDLKKQGVSDKIYSFEYINNSNYYGLATREAKKVNRYTTFNI